MTAGARVREERVAEIRAMLADHEWLSRDGRQMNKAGRAIRDLLAALDQARAAALEEAAKVCDAERARRAELARQQSRHPDALSAYHTEASECADELAEAIRALAARGRENPEAFVEAYDRAVKGNGDWS